jgi:RNA polymerase sigma factor (sigma-70 family)
MQEIENWSSYRRSRRDSKKFLSSREEIFLITECLYGGETRRLIALEEIININISIVHNLAKNYRWSYIPYEDIVQYGIEGLICAVDNFNLEKGNKFSTYAHHYVLGRIRRAIEQYNNLIRKPAYINIAGLKLLNVDEDVSDTELEKYRNDRYSISQLRNAINAKKQKIVGEEELEYEVVEVTSYNEICNKDLIQQVLKDLKDREVLIIKMRFGLEEYEPHTFKEIDTKTGCDSEQVMRASFIKLRSKFRFEDLLEVFRWS